MRVFEHELYLEDIKNIATLQLPWEKLENRSIMITGGTGMIGSFLVDVLEYRNRNYNMNCRIYIICRNGKNALERFVSDNQLITIVEADINFPVSIDSISKIDYVIHLASNTHPKAYANDPIGTILTNVLGTKNIIEFGERCSVKRYLFASSVEIYGENYGDVDTFDEKYCGYIDCNTLRAGYPESKRCGEALCQAYIKQRNLDIVIARLSRTYGANMHKNDTKALSQFLNHAVYGKNIVLKSSGEQYYSYIYVADAVSGILKVLLSGENGEAYNIANENSDIRLKELAQMIAYSVGKKVVFQYPTEDEITGYSKATLARMSNKKIKALGWEPICSIDEGVRRTLTILGDC